VKPPRPAEQTLTCFSTAIFPGVERRRIYDIVNVFEALEIVGRKAKNTYVWRGLDNLDYTLAKLKVRHGSNRVWLASKMKKIAEQLSNANLRVLPSVPSGAGS